MNLAEFLREQARRFPKLVGVYETIRSPVTEAVVLNDLVRTRRSVSFLRHGDLVTAIGDPVILVMPTNWVYEIKIMLMLGIAIRMNGRSPLILAGPRHRAQRVGRYSRAFGLTNITYEDDVYLTPSDEAYCHEMTEEYMSMPMSFQAVKAWEFRGCQIGRQVLSSVSRDTRTGTPDPTRADTANQIRRLLPFVFATVLRTERLVSETSPALAITNESNYAIRGALVDALLVNGVGVVQVTQPSRDDALICRRLTVETRRQHPSSISAATWALIQSVPWTEKAEERLEEEFSYRYSGKWKLQQRNHAATRPRTRQQLSNDLGLDTRRKIAVVFSHILWDANLFYGEDLFDDYAHWFVETARAAANNSSVNWIIKVHPANAWKLKYQGAKEEYSELELLKDSLGILPNHMRILLPSTDVDALSLYRDADYGVTVRGTPGMEMACFGKRVFTSGTGRYSGVGFTTDSSSRSEYLRNLANIHTFPDLTSREHLAAKRHAYASFVLRPWVMKSFTAEFRWKQHGSSPLDHNLRTTCNSWSCLERNGDLRKWGVWALSQEIDYVDSTLHGTKAASKSDPLYG